MKEQQEGHGHDVMMPLHDLTDVAQQYLLHLLSEKSGE
tara:strand:- start:104 stop:217 length:114 start_codon:yes stop_codon:yes gene_type:complete